MENKNVSINEDLLLKLSGILCFSTGYVLANRNFKNTLLAQKLIEARDLVLKELKLNPEEIFKDDEDKQETGSY
jgi:hypothetical protein